MILYNENQKKCIEHPPGPLMIIAGAGTGKTTTLIARIAYFINDRGIAPENILALTYTVKAAEHLQKSLSKMVHNQTNNINASNFHSFALNHIINYHKFLGYSSLPTLIEPNELRHVVKELISQSVGSLMSSVYKKDIQVAYQNVPRMFDRFRDELFLDDELLEKRDAILKNENSEEVDLQLVDCINLFIEYQNYKNKHSLIDFGDMISDLWSLVNDKQILSEIQSTVKHIVVDEYQDNNYALSQIVMRLAGKDGSVTVVGDDDQSIYSFRGANVIAFNEFRDYYQSFEDYSEIILDVNYRSPQAVLNFADQTVKGNSFRIKDQALLSNKEIDNNVNLYSGSKSMQLTKIVSLTMQYLQEGVKPNEICVLTRSGNNAQEVSNYFNQFSIKNSYRSGKLFDSNTAKNFMSFLNIIYKNIHMETGLYRIIDGSSYSDLLDTTDSMKNIKSELFYGSGCPSHELIKELRIYIETKDANPVLLYTQFSEKFMNCSNSSKILMIIQEMIEKYQSFYRGILKGNLCDFLNSMFEINDIYIEEDVDYEQSVSIMTVHQSKGMEFDYVMIPFLGSQTFPISKGKSINLDDIPDQWVRNKGLLDVDRIEEERRIFHVAATRAKKSLSLFAPPKRRSRFFKDIEEQSYIEVELSEDNQLTEEQFEYEFSYKNKIKMSYSATSLSMYEKCPLSFKLSKIDRVGEGGYSPAASFGLFVHKALEEIYSRKINTKESINTLLLEIWEDDKFENPYQSEEYRKESCDVIYEYIKLNSPDPSVCYYFEKSLRCSIDEDVLYGKLDRIDLMSDGSTGVVDYKTSKTKKTKGFLKKDIQLAFYSFLLKNSKIEGLEGKIPDVCRLEFVRDPDEPSVEISYEPSDMIELEYRIRSIIKSIKDNNFYPKKNASCYFCEYKKLLCPLYK